MTVRQSSSRSLFDNFFNDSFSGFSSGRPLAVKTDSIHLHVKALSDEGKPANFTGLVGTFRMESTLEPASLQAGESATLTVQVKGQGTVNRIPDLDLPEMEFVRTYRDQPVLETEQSRQGITGTKTMKWALVPENAEFKDTLAMALLGNNQIDQALLTIRKAMKLQPANPTFQYHLAIIMSKSGDSEGAISELSNLLKQDKTFPEKAEAVQLLEQLKIKK